ncbi:MAG: FkbM family methyltransferase [Proteobacteria bacterium]|nr:FkbM family methyltransferase [Pseudomonadota bacterium]
MSDQLELPQFLLTYAINSMDVGARGGMQRHWRKHAALIRNIDLFEPDEVACAAQAQRNEPGQSWFPVALGGRTGTARLYVTSKPSGSSLYEPNPDVMRRFSAPSYGSVAKVVDVPLMTIADFIDKYRRPVPELLKLDVQGAELDILRQLRPEHLAGLLAVQAEVSFVEFYKSQPLFADVDTFMRSQGFVMYDLLPSRSYRFDGERSHGQLRRHLNIVKNRNDISRRLIEADALYLRAPETVLAGGKVGEILKLFIILLLYRFLDEALWLVEAARDAKILEAAEAAALINIVKSAAPKPGLLQRADRIGKWARRIAKSLGLLRRKADYWLDRSWDF